MLTEEELLAKLTIGIPVYNDREFIGETLESCVSQAGQILVYDNGSDDGTSDICAEYARKYPHIKHTRHERNLGSYENFRLPLFDCRTEYFLWVGSHDLLSKNFSLNLLRVLETDASIALAFGRIAYIDEKGAAMKTKNKSRYSVKMLSDDPFERAKTLLSDLRDAVICYGLFRTEMLQKACVDEPCIGCDDVVLLKAALIGKFSYTDNSTFFARAFPVYRKNIEDRKRQSAMMVAQGEKPAAQNLNRMVELMMEAVTSMPQYADNMGKGFQVFDFIRKRYLEPRQERKARRNRLMLASLLFLAFAALLLTTGYFYSRCR